MTRAAQTVKMIEDNDAGSMRRLGIGYGENDMKSARTKRIPGRFMAAGLSFLATAAMADLNFGDLVFIDDFEDPVIRNSSPAPGMPGSGILGGANFWWSSGPGAPAVFSNYVDASRLNLEIYSPNNLHNITSLRSTTGHEEFNFMGYSPGEGLLLSVRDLALDWADGSGRLTIGFTDDPSQNFYRGTNKAYVSFVQSQADFGTVRLHLVQEYMSEASVHTLQPDGTERPTGMDLYLDGLFYILTVFYDHGGSQEAFGFHGFGGEWDAMALRIQFQPMQTTFTAMASIGEISVTYIPEPGAVSLFGVFGAALMIRRARRRTGRPGK